MSGLRDVSLDRRRCRGEELVSVSISERRRRLLSLFLSCLASLLSLKAVVAAFASLLASWLLILAEEEEEEEEGANQIM